MPCYAIEGKIICLGFALWSARLNPLLDREEDFSKISGERGELRADDKLVFLHFEKTAGTTVHACLSRLFTFEQICPFRGSDVVLLPRTTPYRYFACHANLIDFRFLKGPIKVVTFLREPVERCVSLYTFWKSHNEQAVAEQRLILPNLARSTGLCQLFSPEMYPQAGFLWNRYARGLAGHPFLSPKGKLWQSKTEILEAAMRNMDALAFVGISENLDLSFKILSQRLAIANVYTGEFYNKTEDNHLLDPSMFEPIHSLDIDSETFDTIANANDLDILLYRTAVERLFGQAVLTRTLRCHAGPEDIATVMDDAPDCWIEGRGAGPVMFGPYCRLFPGSYNSRIRLRWPMGTPAEPGLTLGTADICLHKGTRILHRTSIVSDAFVGGVESTVALPFVLDSIGEDVEFRVWLDPDRRLEVCADVAVERKI